MRRSIAPTARRRRKKLRRLKKKMTRCEAKQDKAWHRLLKRQESQRVQQLDLMEALDNLLENGGMMKSRMEDVEALQTYSKPNPLHSRSPYAVSSDSLPSDAALTLSGREQEEQAHSAAPDFDAYTRSVKPMECTDKRHTDQVNEAGLHRESTLNHQDSVTLQELETRKTMEDLLKKYQEAKDSRQAAFALFDNRHRPFAKAWDEWYERAANGQNVGTQEDMDLRQLSRSILLVQDINKREEAVMALRAQLLALDELQVNSDASSCFDRFQPDETYSYEESVEDAELMPGQLMAQQKWREWVGTWNDNASVASEAVQELKTGQRTKQLQPDDWEATSVAIKDSYSAVDDGDDRRRIDRWMEMCTTARENALH